MVSCTVTRTRSVAVPPLPSLTVSSNSSTVLAVTVGEVNEGVGVVAPESVTAGPSVWAHEKVSGSESGSAPEPLSVTSACSFTTRSTPASAVGGALTVACTVTTTRSVALAAPSFTVSSNSSAVSAATAGAVKPGVGVVLPDSVTAGPEVCAQAKVRGSASASLPLPDSVTGATLGTVWSTPASAVGGWLAKSLYVWFVTPAVAVRPPKRSIAFSPGL